MQYNSPVGLITITAKDGAVSSLTFGNADPGAENGILTPSDKAALDAAVRWLDIYFTGRDPGFLPPLKPAGTPFRQSVWNALLTVPYGHTASYGDIARMTGCRSAQTVGQAIHNNPIAIIIPCHRIIGSDGSLTGYAGGLSRKAALLQIEGTLLL